MKKYFVDIPINKFYNKGRRIMYALGDLASCHVHFKYEADGFLFKTYYRPSGYWQAYYLKYDNNIKIIQTDFNITFLNNIDQVKVNNVKILYQDKVCRLLQYTTRGCKKDFVFALKSQESEDVSE